MTPTYVLTVSMTFSPLLTCQKSLHKEAAENSMHRQKLYDLKFNVSVLSQFLFCISKAQGTGLSLVVLPLHGDLKPHWPLCP